MKIAESKRNIFRKKIDGKFPKDTKKRTGFGKNQLRKNLFVVGMLSGCDDSFFGFLALCKSELYFNGV